MFVPIPRNFFTENFTDLTVSFVRRHFIYKSQRRIILSWQWSPIEAPFYLPHVSRVNVQRRISSIELSHNHYCVFNRPSCWSVVLIGTCPEPEVVVTSPLAFSHGRTTKAVNNGCETQNLGQRMLRAW